MPEVKAKSSSVPPAPAEASPPRPGVSLKLVAVVGAIMLAEAAGVYVLVVATGPRAATAAAEVHGMDQAPLMQSVEIELIDDKFQNMQTGRIWMWDVQIVLKVKAKDREFVEQELKRRSAEIREGIAQIMRRAMHSHLREPELTTLNRQIAAYLDKTLGLDPDGRSRIERVMIPKCKGYQIEQ